MTEETKKKITITLSGRAPVTVTDEDWPCIATGSYRDWDNQFEFQANRKWRGRISVRQHEDGRAIVYGRDCFDTQFQNEADHDLRGGELVEVYEDLVPAIRRVADELIERGADPRMSEVAHECIASLPAEEL